MYTPTQLAIIKRFGRKELTFGCHIIDYDGYHAISVGDTNMETYLDDQGYLVRDVPDEKVGIKKILGHIPHLEDVFRVAMERNIPMKIWSSGELFISKDTSFLAVDDQVNIDPTIPLLDQSEETLKSILNLFSNA